MIKNEATAAPTNVKNNFQFIWRENTTQMQQVNQVSRVVPLCASASGFGSDSYRIPNGKYISWGIIIGGWLRLFFIVLTINYLHHIRNW
jgi:hypothetical protein